MATIPLTLEAVLAIAVERLQSKAGLEPTAFMEEFKEHRNDLVVLLPQLRCMDQDRRQRALEQAMLETACDLGWIDGR